LYLIKFLAILQQNHFFCAILQIKF